MAEHLYRLGRFAYRRRVLVTLLWLGLLALTGLGAGTLSGPTANAFSVPGTEAQHAMDLLTERFPEAAADGASARVVFAAPAGETLTDPANRATVDRVLSTLRAAPQVANVADPYATGAVNQAGSVAFAEVAYRVEALDLSEAARAALTGALETGRAGGLTVELGGEAAQEPAPQGLSEAVGIVVAGVVLVITFGSLLAAGLPLLTAVLGIAISLAAITAVTGFVDLSEATPMMAVMLGLAVAIDYALFIVFRYRHEVTTVADRAEAVGRAVGTAGSAVVFAGLTVVIALVGLSVVGIPILTQMGLAAAGTVLVAVLIALTLLPALLGFAGRRALPRPRRNPTERSAAERNTAGQNRARQNQAGQNQAGQERAGRRRAALGLRWARFVVRRPVPVLVVAAAALGVLAVPALDLRLGLPDDGTAAPQTTQRKAYDLLSAGFGPGFNGPLVVTVDARYGGAEGVTRTDTEAAARRTAETLGRLPGVLAVTPPTVNRAGDTAVLTVVPASAPSSPATRDLVAAIRATTGPEVAVTGRTAIDIDMSDKLGGALLPYLGVVVGLAFLLLTLVFRSLLVPLKATLGFLLSVAATFGAVVAIFQWGWLAGVFGVDQPGPIVSLLPTLMIGLVFGLAMDYQVFLVSRMREEYVRGAGPTAAVVAGFGHGARVVTAAAAIMVAVFSGFLLAPDALVKSIGFALAAAVLFDAFVVRMTIVPAAMALLGRAAWWLPRWLDRLLPDVDIEGERLLRAAPPTPATEPEQPQPAPV
ncbi:MMPL family transporter [Plantactinospora mayteni]|uniref:Membrane protein n=1 Tax=Plantactinospora mayteni TaxID=566021 RepID=A0ABQ4ET43_9ACTN|nr:MMPL family transporter [Plantactinospora mayteni]GIG97818.1 membrane protein [Plantactinospora mayteni]